MKTKKLAVIIVAIVFVSVMLISCIALFSVKKINVNYSVGETSDTASIQKELDGFKGKNLLFLDESEVADSLSDFYYMEVVSVKKNFPNEIDVEIKQRVEVYEIVDGGVSYVTTENGFVLDTVASPAVVGEESLSRDKIRLSLKGVTISDASAGKIISTSADELLARVFEMAKSVQLTNSIKLVELDVAIEKANAIFYTYTGVKIVVNKIMDDGVKKIETAFEKYNSALSDYEKTFDKIEVNKLSSTGEIRVTWSGQEK